jgi:hypothetical protein
MWKCHILEEKLINSASSNYEIVKHLHAVIEMYMVWQATFADSIPI